MIDRIFHLGHGVVGADHDLAGAVLVDQMTQRFAGKDQGIEIELFQILTRLFFQRRTFAIVGEHGSAVIHARGVGRQKSTAVGAADFHLGEAVEGAFED